MSSQLINQLNNISLELPQQQSTIKILRQTIFNFKSNSKDKIHHSKLLSSDNQYLNDCIVANNSMMARPMPIREAYFWKPKIPSKKLLQQPKFLLSLERKKIKAQNSVQKQNIPKTQRASKNFKSDKIKFFSKSFYKQPQQNRFIHSYVSQQIRNKSFTERNFQRKQKTPHLNFNMHYLINKRKKLIMQQVLIKGSNAPYYSIFGNQKLQADEVLTQNKNKKNQSQRISRLRVSKTADHRKKIKPLL